MDCSSTGPLQATVPAGSLLQSGLSMGCSFLQDTSACSGMGPSTGHRLDICSTVDIHGLQGANLYHYGLHHRLRGNFCSGTRSTSSPSSFTDRHLRRTVSLFLTPLSQLLCSIFHPFLNMLSERQNQHCQLAPLWSAAGPTWSQLKLTVSDMGAGPGVVWQNVVVSPWPGTKNLVTTVSPLPLLGWGGELEEKGKTCGSA